MSREREALRNLAARAALQAEADGFGHEDNLKDIAILRALVERHEKGEDVWIEEKEIGADRATIYKTNNPSRARFTLMDALKAEVRKASKEKPTDEP